MSSILHVRAFLLLFLFDFLIPENILKDLFRSLMESIIAFALLRDHRSFYPSLPWIQLLLEHYLLGSNILRRKDKHFFQESGTSLVPSNHSKAGQKSAAHEG